MLQQLQSLCCEKKPMYNQERNLKYVTVMKRDGRASKRLTYF